MYVVLVVSPYGTLYDKYFYMIVVTPLLQACDVLRDEQLPERGVLLEDKEGHTVVKYVGRETALRERDNARKVSECHSYRFAVAASWQNSHLSVTGFAVVMRTLRACWLEATETCPPPPSFILFADTAVGGREGESQTGTKEKGRSSQGKYLNSRSSRAEKVNLSFS